MGSLSSLPATQRSYNYGPFVVPTRYIALPFKAPRIDNLVAHDSRIDRESVGTFCGSPIFSMDEKGMDADVLAAVYVNVKVGKKQREEGLVGTTAEILPGEELCTDNIIRRSTTAEAIGYDAFYAQQREKVVNAKEVTLAQARKAAKAGAMITWLQNTALIHQEEA